ncbi:MAG: restriction endonuclease [Acidobacteriota bacterium]|nr:restriction endonuclease [Acidobacteriota bacterium]
MTKRNNRPTFDELMNPLLKAVRDLGGSGSVDEIYEKVAENLHLPEAVLSEPHNPETGNQTEIEYRLAWARTYLKKYGILENSSRGVWAITQSSSAVEEVDPKEVVRFVQKLDKQQRVSQEKKSVREIVDDTPEEVQSWRATLHSILTKQLDPAAFERLVKRLLRESGFTHVEVTGRTGDGGIDGKGIAKIYGFLSFHVVFQCKRYQGTITASQIRDFRGAMAGRADKGLFITTSSFTRDAIKEATRNGAPPIDLVDGDQLADKLKELSLGIKNEVVEKITVEEEWFKSI